MINVLISGLFEVCFHLAFPILHQRFRDLYNSLISNEFRLGSKACYFLAQLMSTAGLFAFHLINQQNEDLVQTLSFATKLFTTAAFYCSLFFVLKLFPTLIRSHALGFCILSGSSGLLLGLFVDTTQWFLGFHWLLLGVLSSICVLCILVLPDILTHDQHLRFYNVRF
ncbi:hypothetical protein M3Y98_00238300 [Aphelenchoides besseyi]|nr:hypothetical protein M3Y98_00238300 [Aphelenchoides besseyi]